MGNIVEQIFRAELRHFTALLTSFIIFNLGMVLIFVFQGKNLKVWKKKIITAWIIIDIVIIIMVPLNATKRYQERIIPNNTLNEETQNKALEEKKKKLGIE